MYNGLTALSMRCAVGVFSGLVFTGVVGWKTRHDYTVLGDAINMSARLMSKADELDVGVLCGQQIFDSCNLRIEFDILPPVLVKGKEEPIAIYRPCLSTTERPEISATPENIIGREDKQSILAQHVYEMHDHYNVGFSTFLRNYPSQLARTIVLEGMPGMGKSFLAQFAVFVGEQINSRTVVGHSHAVHQLTPYFSWREVLLNLLSMNPAANASHFTRILRDLRRSMQSPLLPYLPLLHLILPELPFTLEEIERADKLSASQRDRYVMEIIKSVVEHQSCQTSMVLVLEDLQWMDGPSIRILNAIAETVYSLVIVATTRELSDSQRNRLAILGHPRTTHLILEPLKEIHCISILQKHLGTAHLPREIRPLLAQVQGNPLYCEELAYSLLARRVMDGGVFYYNRLAHLNIPDSVEGLISSRIDLQSISAQNLLKVASVIGYEFNITLLHGIYNVSFAGDIRILQAQNFIHQNSPSTFQFHSEVVCKVAYSRLLVSKRKEWHRKIAMWYEAREARSDMERNQYTQLLAYHWYEALEGQEMIDDASLRKAIHYMSQSAYISAQQVGTEEAAAVIQRALRFVERLDDERKQVYVKKLRLQLMGLPVKNLHGFSIPNVHFPSHSSHRQTRRPEHLSDEIRDPRRQSALVELSLDSRVSRMRRSSFGGIPPAEEQTQPIIEGALRRKRWGRWKTVYCVLRRGILTLYKTSKQIKALEVIPLKLTHVRSLPEENDLHPFSLSSRLEGALVLASCKDIESHHWVAALSAFSEVPELMFDLEGFQDTAMIITTGNGKIEDINGKAETLLGFTKAELLGVNIKRFFRHDALLEKYLKHQGVNLVGTVHPVNCASHDGTTRQLAMCVAEFTQTGRHKILIRLTHYIQDYPPELQSIFEPCDMEEDILDMNLRL